MEKEMSIVFDNYEEWTNRCYYSGFILIPLIYALYAIDKYYKLGEYKNGKRLTEVPPYTYLFGHMFELVPEKFLKSLQKWNQSEGSLYDVFIFNQRMRMISDFDLAIEIMQKRPHTFRRGKTMVEAFEHLAIGIPLTASEGSRWSHLRRLASPQFNHRNVASLLHIIQGEARAMVSSIECDVITSGTDICTQYAASTIGRLTLGIECEDMKDYFGTKQLVEDLDIFVHYLIERMFYPLPKWTWPYSNKIRLEVKARQANDRMDKACKAHIMKIRSNLTLAKQARDLMTNSEEVFQESASLSAPKSLVEVLIANNEKELMTDEDCILNVKTFLGAGADTTGIATAWVLYFLTLNPACVAALRDELNKVGFHPNSHTEHISYEGMQDLKYAFAVVKEAIRLKSPAAINILELNTGVNEYVCTNGMVIKPGDQVCIDYDGILKNPYVFPDPERFNPHRWLDADKETLIKMEKYYIAFGGGPRKCPAFSLSHIEVVMCVCTLVDAFNWEIACPIMEIERVLQFTAKPNKLPLIFHARECQHS